jgi:uncharacterized protein (DUF58 family)
MLPNEIRKKIKLLEISTRKLVNSVFVGQYHSAFKGQGMTFAEFREYVPGDDVRAISWPLTARTGKTFIKKFDEDRELTLIFAVDMSGSVDYGSQKYFKGEVITHLAALLGFSAQKNNDHVGLLMFSDQVEYFVPPKKGRGHIQRLLRDLYYFKPQRRGTNISTAMSYLQGILKKRATIFVFSDFQDQNFSVSIRSLARKHEVIACVIQDPSEKVLPDFGLIEMLDPETGEEMLVDTGSATFRAEYQKQLLAQDKLRGEELKKARIDVVQVMVGESFVDPLVGYFRKKNARRS